MDQLAEILGSFGVTWEKFIAQVIIFLVVYLVLNKYAFPPLIAVMEARRRRIADGEQKLKEIATRLEQSAASAQARLEEANGRAERMIAEARESAETVADRKRQDAVHEAGEIISKAQEATKLERERMLADLKNDFGRLVIEATGNVTGKVLSKTDQDRINKETATQIAS